ncbi:hypothetical protein GCM10023063_13600 [Arthrobacter methylotrophus]
MFAQLTLAGFDEKDALGKHFGERLSRGIHNESRTALADETGELRIEILRHSRRKATAGHHVSARRDRPAHKLQAGAPFVFAELCALKHETELVPGRILINGEVLPGAPLDRDDQGRDLLTFHQPSVGFPRRTACGVHGQDLPPEPLDYAGNVYATAARIEAASAAPQLMTAVDPIR